MNLTNEIKPIHREENEMKNYLFEIRAYAKGKGFSERRIERLIDEIENGFMTKEEFEDICFAIDCEAEYL